ncbi:LysR family transcriptional regulator [Shewanella olleyana]|uniref:LysR family transcriptional regulator n=1 Tax=Shewanella olleyana TaxID=135626 RepID=UPI00200E6225|nr:LysR family transcriptional regulator [Shewanella olleyana]MCL1066723.1 LysR family transcriptional regulator [Shewanella olleyana]
MELRHIKHFVVLAELRHFYRAAEKLNITQPSLSKSIKKLELLIGGKLFDRTTKEVQITALGKLVLARSLKILREVESLHQDISNFNGTDTKELNIGASPIPSNSLVGPIIGYFLRDFPDMAVELKVAGWSDLYQQLVNGDIDFFVAAETKKSDIDKSELVTMVDLPPFPVIFCCRPNHPLLSLPRLFLPTLRDYPLAIPRHLPEEVSHIFEDLFMIQRDDFSGLVRFEQFHPIKEAIMTGDLVALTPEIAVRAELESGALVSLKPTMMPELFAQFCIVYLKQKSQSPSAKAFIEYLKERAMDVKLKQTVLKESA